MPRARFDTLAAARYRFPNHYAKERTNVDLEKVFGQNVFGLREMQSSLPKPQFKALLSTIRDGTPLDLTVADASGSVMAVLRRASRSLASVLGGSGALTRGPASARRR